MQTYYFDGGGYQPTVNNYWLLPSPEIFSYDPILNASNLLLFRFFFYFSPVKHHHGHSFTIFISHRLSVHGVLITPGQNGEKVTHTR